jgi:hypothetical protein
MTATAVPFAGPGTASRGSEPWIQSARFDSAIFILSPLLGLLVLLASGGSSRAVAPLLATSLIGFPHYFSTFAFYFWDENRERNTGRWLAFFAAPAAIVITTLLLFRFHIPFVIAVVTYFWNCFHVSRQSCGILSIYRHRGGRSTVADKSAANAAIILTNLWFALWQTETYPTLHRWLTIPAPWFAQFLWISTGVLAIGACVRLGRNLIARHRDGAPASSPELLFLATSILLFHPYIWVKDPALATIGMLVGHFVQYLGIVWLLHRRKYAEGGDHGRTPAWLRNLSTDNRLLAGAILATGLLTLAVFTVMHFTGGEGIFEGMYMSIAFVHFYLDGLFWAFRDPHVRSTIGPYFRSPQRAAA